MTEKIFSKILKINCRFEGCQENLLIEKMKTHEFKCEFRTIECPINYEFCKSKIALNSIYKHVQDKHRAVISTPNSTFGLKICVPEIMSSQDSEIPLVIKGCLGLYFVVKQKFRSGPGLYQFHLKVIKPEDWHLKFDNSFSLAYSLRVINQDHNQVSL